MKRGMPSVIVGAVVAVILGLVGLLALVWRLIWSPFAKPPSVPDHQPQPPQRMDVIEVESVVVTDEPRALEDKEQRTS